MPFVRNAQRSRQYRCMRAPSRAPVVLAARKTVSPERLLEWQATEGWEPICRALGRPLDYPASAASFDSVAIARAQRKLMSELGPGARVIQRFRHRLPQMMLRVDPEALQQLRQSDLVVTISLNETDDEKLQEAADLGASGTGGIALEKLPKVYGASSVYLSGQMNDLTRRAESTATTRLPASAACTIRPAARLVRSASATEVPPNFITTVPS